MTSKSLRVLMIDDSELDSLLAIRHLSHGGYSPTLRREEDEVGTRAALSEGKWDVLFCDSSMPGFGAGKALELLQKMKLEVPLIVVSGSTGEEAAAAALRLGAVDWVSKRDLSRLVPVVEKHVHRGDVPTAKPADGTPALHSFNNALSVVLTYASVLLNETPRDNPIRADIEEIEKAANTAAALALSLFEPHAPQRDRDEDDARREALILVEASARASAAAMKCEVCGSDDLRSIEYRTPDLCAPALECDRCKAIKLDETVAHSPQEREWVRNALARRATVGGAPAPRGVAESPSRSPAGALHDICDEIGNLLTEAQSALRSLMRTDAPSAEGIASAERTMRQIAGLVESVRSAV